MTSLIDGSTGAVAERYVYNAYGVTTIYDGPLTTRRTSSSYANSITWDGYYYDLESGFYYVGARYYSPEERPT